MKHVRSTLIILLTSLTALSADSFTFDEPHPGVVHGFIGQGAVISSDNNFLTYSDRGSFEFTEIGLNYTQQLTNDLSAGVQLFFRNYGLEYDRQLTVDWAFGDWRPRDYFSVRLGKFKLPYGLHNQARDADVARTWVLLPQSVYDESFRDFILALYGAEIYGIVPLKWAGSLEYEVYIGAVRMGASSNLLRTVFRGLAEPLGASVIKNEQIETQYIAGGVLVWRTPLDGLTLAATGAVGNTRWSFEYPNLVVIPGAPPELVTSPSNSTIKMELDIASWVFSAQYVWRWMTLTGEYARLRAPASVILDPGPGIPSMTLPDLPVDREGVYGSLEIRPCEQLVIGGYYSVYFPDRKDRSSSPMKYQRDIDLTARYDFNEYITLKLEAHRIHGTSHLDPYANMKGLKKVWYLYMAKATVSF